MEPQKPHRIRDVKWSNQDSVKIFEFIKFLENITLENNTLLFNGGPVSLEKQPVLVDLDENDATDDSEFVCFLCTFTYEENGLSQFAKHLCTCCMNLPSFNITHLHWRGDIESFYESKNRVVKVMKFILEERAGDVVSSQKPSTSRTPTSTPRKRKRTLTVADNQALLDQLDEIMEIQRRVIFTHMTNSVTKAVREITPLLINDVRELLASPSEAEEKLSNSLSQSIFADTMKNALNRFCAQVDFSNPEHVNTVKSMISLLK